MKAPLLPPPNSQKRNLEERNPGSLPHFRFLKMGRQEGVNSSPKTTASEKKRFILVFQL